MTWDDAVAILAEVAETKATAVENGLYGPLITVRITPSLTFSMSFIEGGVLLVNTTKPGGSIFLSDEVAAKTPALKKWFDAAVKWQDGERWAALGDDIAGAPPRVKSPGPLDVRGTVMTVDEAFLGFMVETDDTLSVLEEPFHATGAAPTPMDEWWVLLAGVVDAEASSPTVKQTKPAAARRSRK